MGVNIIVLDVTTVDESAAHEAHTLFFARVGTNTVHGTRAVAASSVCAETVYCSLLDAETADGNIRVNSHKIL